MQKISIKMSIGRNNFMDFFGIVLLPNAVLGLLYFAINSLVPKFNPLLGDELEIAVLSTLSQASFYLLILINVLILGRLLYLLLRTLVAISIWKTLYQELLDYNFPIPITHRFGIKAVDFDKLLDTLPVDEYEDASYLYRKIQNNYNLLADLSIK